MMHQPFIDPSEPVKFEPDAVPPSPPERFLASEQLVRWAVTYTAKHPDAKVEFVPVLKEPGAVVVEPFSTESDGCGIRWFAWRP